MQTQVGRAPAEHKRNGITYLQEKQQSLSTALHNKGVE